MKGQQLSKLIAYAFLGYIAALPLCHAHAANPLLLVMNKEQDLCQVSVQSPEDNKIDHWFSAPECPEDMVFDNAQRKAIFLQKDKYFTVEFKPDAAPAYYADAYKMPIDWSSETKTWVDQKTGNLRFAYVISSDGAGDSHAIVMEREATGHWKKLAEKSTTIEMADALGLGAVKEYMPENPDVFTLQDLVMDMTCAEQECMDRDNQRFKVPAKINKKIVAAVVQDDESGETMPTNISLGENEGFLAGAVFGDTMHWTGPVFYYSKAGSHEKAQYRDKQSLISAKNHYVLISQEYESTSATLYKSGMNGEPFLEYKPDALVVWLPAQMNW